MAELPTEPIRQEHRELARHLDHLDRAAAHVTSIDGAAAASLLPRLVAFLRDDLLSHAREEEEVLYPAVDRIAGAGVTATMVADHVGIAERIETLADSVGKALEAWNEEAAADMSRQLAALSAIVDLHFRKEEEVLLPILDEGLSVEEGHALFETAHGHGGHHHE